MPGRTADPGFRLAALAWVGGVAIVAGLGLGEWLLGDWWLGLGVAGAWVAATAGLGLVQGRPVVRGRGVPPGRRGDEAGRGRRTGTASRQASRRPHVVPPPGRGVRVVAGPVHADGAWVRTVAAAGGLRFETWTAGAWRTAADDLAVLATAMPRGRPRQPMAGADPPGS